jgi:hypothetical protein
MAEEFVAKMGQRNCRFESRKWPNLRRQNNDKEFYNRSLKRIDDTLDTRYISKMLQILFYLEIWYKMFITMEMSPKNFL